MKWDRSCSKAGGLLDWVQTNIARPRRLAMSQIAPPRLPMVDEHDERPRRRVRTRLLQIALASATVFATVWCYQLHIALCLTATFLAKHILVAILAAGLRLPIRSEEHTSELQSLRHLV